MESTIFISLAIGITCALLALDGTACLMSIESACFLDHSSNIVMVVIGYATIIPITLCLVAAWMDAKESKQEERTRLLDRGFEPEKPIPHRVNMYLYASHFLSAWGDRMWAFAVPILFMEIFVDTLLPSACFSLVMYTVCIFAIPSVGKFLDASNRWSAMKYAIILENISIILSSITMGLILLVTNADGLHKPTWTPRLTSLFSVILICGGIGQVLNDAQSLAIVKDWVVVLAGEDSEKLSHFNTTMRRIDLGCKILSPMMFGIIMDYAGNDPTSRAMIGAATVGIWNLISTPLEYYMTRDIFYLTPALGDKETVVEDPREETSQSTIRTYLRMWREYFYHPVFLLSFAFCALYMTILDGGALNTAYLKWRGLPDSIIGSSRGAGAVTGLLGTFLFPTMCRWIGKVERVAVFGVWLFWLTLVPVAFAFLFTGESTTSDYIMLACMILSRTWLWNADLAETQIMQEWVEPSKRGSINSMQTATYQFFYILIQLMGMIFHDPANFESLVFFSLASVFASAAGFTIWNWKYGVNRHLYVRPRGQPVFTKK